MKKDIILCGVGGQGILSIATIIGEAATLAGLELKQAEVHGMSQRGGDVQSNLRLSTETIYSDDRSTLQSICLQHTGLTGLSVNKHCTCTAGPLTASVLDRRQVHFIPQEAQKRLFF